MTGTTPFDRERLKGAGHDEIRRIIREEEPTRPSARVSTMGPAGITVSADRKTDPRRLSQLFRGELDWIVMKALEKDRNRRYETAASLAADVRRYLTDEPVQACPPSVSYRIRKFARRHSGALTAAALVLLGLTVAAGSIGWSLRDRAARDARAKQEHATREARLSGQVELILGEMQRLQREHKWPEALEAVRRAAAVADGGPIAPAVDAKVHDALRGLEFVRELDEIRMVRAAVWNRGFENSRAAASYERAFEDFGVHLEDLPPREARLRKHPDILLPLAAALDDFSDARRQMYGHSDDFRLFLLEVARGLDPDPLRDQFRALLGRHATPEAQAKLEALAERINVAGQAPATIVLIARTLDQVGHQDSLQSLLRRAQLHHPDDFWINFDLAFSLSKSRDYEGCSILQLLSFGTPVVHCRARQPGQGAL